MNSAEGASRLESTRVAALQVPVSEGRVRCDLCGHRCTVRPGLLGVCRVRRNQSGVLYSLVYGRSLMGQIDPIEKKPLYHVRPGSATYSVAAPGCNFRCRWCQNWDLSQLPRHQAFELGHQISPQQTVQAAVRAGCRTIAYTYTEPTVFFEYLLDTARLAKRAGLSNVAVTNGYMTPEAFAILRPHLDAVNVDLKAFRDRTYRCLIGARLQPVLDFMKTAKQAGTWLEVTTLVVPGVNDEDSEIRDIARFVASELGVDTPLHFTRFLPSYKFKHVPPTRLATLRHARDLAREEGLRYVYLGSGVGEMNTACHTCGRTLVRRIGYRVLENAILPSQECPDCGTLVAGRHMVE